MSGYMSTHLGPTSGGCEYRHNTVSEGHEQIFALDLLLGAGDHLVAITLVWAVLANEDIGIPDWIVLLWVREILIVP